MVENTHHIVCFSPTGLFLPALKTRKKHKNPDRMCFTWSFVWWTQLSQSKWVITPLISSQRKLGCRGFLWLPDVFCGNKLWCPKSSSPFQLLMGQAGSAVCFVLTQWEDAESAEFGHNEASRERPACDIWCSAHRTMTFAASSQCKTWTVHVGEGVFWAFSLNKRFH